MMNRYLDAFQQVLDAWLTRRSLDGVVAAMDEHATGFGTGMDEAAIPRMGAEGNSEWLGYAGQSNLELFERDLREAPNPISWEVTGLAVQTLTPQSAVVMAVMNLSTELAEQALRFNGLRVSLVFVDGPDGVKLCHDHISLPTQLHGEGEAYPLRELEDRLKCFERLLHKRTRTLREAYLELSRVANTDRLTGIASRTRLDEALDAELQRFKRYGSPFSILFFDIDRFKIINDTLGHTEGDNVLCKVAGALSETSRTTDTFGRWGGDEFMAILPETAQPAAQEFARRLVVRIGGMQSADGKPISVSLGIAVPGPYDTVESLFTRADGAMYSAKAQGGGVALG